MSCGRADRVELDAFLLGARGDADLDAFREHYPHCADCAEAVADWMALDGALRGAAAEAGETGGMHPEPEDLARYAEAPAQMGERAMQIESHLSGCARCANELVLIRRFDPAMFGPATEAMPAAARAAETREAGLFGAVREALAGFLETLRGFDLLSPVPALAMAVLVALGLYWSGALEGLGGARPESGAPQLVEQSPPAASPLSGGPAGGGGLPGLAPGTEPAPELRSSETAVAATPEPTAVPVPAPEPMLEPAPAVEVAQVEPKAAPPVEAPEARPPAPSPKAQPSEEILLAALSDLPPPSYATPEGADSVVWMRQFGAVRAAPGAAKVRARAPGDHTGLTLSPTPRLWWALDQSTDLPIQITIVDGDAIDPLLRVELPGPHAAGLHAFDLAQHGAALAPGVDYRWFVSIVVDPDRPSRNPVSAGSLRVAASSDARRETLSSALPSSRGNAFAELGIWYDAFDFYASLAAAHPEVERLATYRDRLADVVEQAP